MGEILPDGSIRYGYERRCEKCGKTIKVNSNGNEIDLHECKHTCTFNLNKYSRDDQGFYLNCVECSKMQHFECNTLDELYELFGLNYDDDE